MDNENAQHRKTVKIVRSLISAVLFAAVLVTGMTEYLMLTEYRPQEKESIGVNPAYSDPLREGDTLHVLTWNCGWGGLGENADYYTEGGKGVYASGKKEVTDNLTGITELSAMADPDVIFFQEVDRESMRSHSIDEPIVICNVLLEEYEEEYTTAFAYNYDVRFVPYPVPPVGKVRSGLMTLTDFSVETAERFRLPSLVKWPARLVSRKYCLLRERIPIKDSDRSLVLFNLQLAHGSASGEEEDAQFRALMDLMNEEAEKGNYVIAGGDFGRTFSNTDISAYSKEDAGAQRGIIDTEKTGGDWQYLMESSYPTCRSLSKPCKGAEDGSLSFYVVDGFIVSANIEVKFCETQNMNFAHSGHNPVLMECVLK